MGTAAMTQQQQQPASTGVNIFNFFTRAPTEPPKQTVTLQKRESEGARTAQTRAEEELGRLEKKLDLQQKTLAGLESQIIQCSQRKQTPPQSLVSRARLIKSEIETTQ